MQELSDTATGLLLGTPPTTQEMTSVALWGTLTSGGTRWSGWWRALLLVLLRSQRWIDGNSSSLPIQEAQFSCASQFYL